MCIPLMTTRYVRLPLKVIKTLSNCFWIVAPMSMPLTTGRFALHAVKVTEMSLNYYSIEVQTFALTTTGLWKVLLLTTIQMLWLC